MPYRPRDWHPIHLETVLYVAPDELTPTLTGTILRPDVLPGHHLTAVGRRIFHADGRDVYPYPDWRAERETRAMENAEPDDDDNGGL